VSGMRFTYVGGGDAFYDYDLVEEGVEGVLIEYEKRMRDLGVSVEVVTRHLVVLRNFLENFLPSIGVRLYREKIQSGGEI